MSRISTASRLACAISDLGMVDHARMPFGVVGGLGLGGPNAHAATLKAALGVAHAIGYKVVTVEMPMKNNLTATVASVGQTASNDLSYATGPKIILVMALGNDLDDRDRAIIAGSAEMAAEAWSIDGETFLLVITGMKTEVARLVGETLKRTDWAAAISL